MDLLQDLGDVDREGLFGSLRFFFPSETRTAFWALPDFLTALPVDGGAIVEMSFGNDSNKVQSRNEVGSK